MSAVPVHGHGQSRPALFPSQAVRQAFKLSLSLVLFYAWGLWTNQDYFDYGALAILLCSLGTRGASLQQGFARIIGTTFGLLIGLAILSWCNHDRWAMLTAFSIYLTLVAYFMQGSRNDYAWYVAAFIPLVVWADNFPNFDNAFHFATARWVETTCGILVYTMVDMVLWPKQAGDQFSQQAQSLWGGVAEMLKSYRDELSGGERSGEVAELQTKVAGARAAAMTSLRQAFTDTPKITADKSVWQAWQRNTEALLDSLALWYETIGDVRALNLPQIESSLQTLQKRVDRISQRCQQRSSGQAHDPSDDSELLERLDLDWVREVVPKLSRTQRAALSCMTQQWKALDHCSRQVLHAERVLAGLDNPRALKMESRRHDSIERHMPLKPKPWIEQRFRHALFPAITFAMAYFFWIYWYPPLGAKIPMFAGILGLVMVRTPMDPRVAVIAYILSIFFLVAPVSWLIMPRLSGPVELLLLIFVYTFVFAWLGKFNPFLRLAPILQLIMASGISNQQGYSFNGLVDGGLMTVLGGGFVAIGYSLCATQRPEANVLRWLKRFFVGCERVTHDYNVQGKSPSFGSQARRRNNLEAMVLPAPAKILAAQKDLDETLFPDCSESMSRLHDCIQRISYRMQSLNTAVNQAGQQPLLESLAQPVGGVVHDVFRHWSKLDFEFDDSDHQSSLQSVKTELERKLESLNADSDKAKMTEKSLVEFYSVLGCIRGLIDAMTDSQAAMKRIDWQAMATPRF